MLLTLAKLKKLPIATGLILYIFFREKTYEKNYFSGGVNHWKKSRTPWKKNQKKIKKKSKIRKKSEKNKKSKKNQKKIKKKKKIKK